MSETKVMSLIQYGLIQLT